MIAIWCMVLLAIWQSSKSVAQTEVDNLWTPEGGRSRDDWLQHHGQSAESIQRVKHKLFELKMNEIAADAPEYDIDEEEQAALLDQDRLDSCIWLTEEQVDFMLDEQKRSKKNNEDNVKHQRKKRKMVNFDKRPQRKWTSMPIHFKFDGKHSHSEKETIRGAFQHWMDQTCVQFEELSVKKEFTEKHILVTKEPTGCHSYPGRVDIIPQQLNLQRSCLSEFGTSVHEIGHALGLWHEQQRADRDDYIRILWDNVIQGYVGQFYKNTKSVDLGVPYDLGSVMHYPPKAGSKNQKFTMESLDPEYQGNMGQKTGLSFLDAKIINVAYCSDKCDKDDLRRPCQREGYQNPKDCNRCICPDGFTGRYCDELEKSRHADCGGEIKVTDKPITIESPGYEKPGYYDNFQFCTWHFTTEHDDEDMVFKFEDEFGVYCHNQQRCHHWAELRFKNSLGVQGPRFCCYQSPDITFRGQLGEMLLVFKANLSIPLDWTSSRRGFKATVYSEPRQGALPTSTEPNTPGQDTPQPSHKEEEEDENEDENRDTYDFEWRCSFENEAGNPTWCDVTQDEDDDFDWTMTKGNTPSGDTGPESAFSGVYYVYAEASRREKDDYAEIHLPEMHEVGPHCVTFYYHMHGFHVHELMLHKRSNSGLETKLWQKTNQQGDRWLEAFTGVNLEDRDRLLFKAVVDGEYSGDIALDSISIHSGDCQLLSLEDPILSNSSLPTEVDVTTVARGATVKTTWLATCFVLMCLTESVFAS